MTTPSPLPPLPAIVISGFLGAGKTTLLNRLLAQGLSGWRLGVIVNDFGKLNLDRHLIDDDRHPVMELSNGCVCCSLQLGLAEAVRALAARGGIDRVVIEASGISVSSALLHVLESAPLADVVRVSKVVAVVDARRYRVLHALPVIRDQVVCADLVVLNHCDEVDAATAALAMQGLKAQNARAEMVLTDHGAIPLELIFSDGRPQKEVAHAAARHEQRWHAYELALPAGDADPDALVAVLDQLPAAVERVKGFVWRGGELHVLQKVAEFPARLERVPGSRIGHDVKANVLVIIAREPVEAQLKQLFPDRSVVVATSVE